VFPKGGPSRVIAGIERQSRFEPWPVPNGLFQIVSNEWHGARHSSERNRGL